jgi:hypothetical protein
MTEVFVLKVMGSKGISRCARDFGKSLQAKGLYEQMEEVLSWQP